MTQLELTKGKYATIDTSDFEFLSKWSWCYSAQGYAVAFDNGKTIYMHRLLMQPTRGMQVDHINTNKIDNRRENLRLVTASQNARNCSKSKNNKSGYKGVYKHHEGKKPWKAQILADGKAVSIGYYETPEEAAKAYDEAAVKYFGEYARLNFPLDQLEKPEYPN